MPFCPSPGVSARANRSGARSHEGQARAIALLGAVEVRDLAERVREG